jgi:hypothetical protein
MPKVQCETCNVIFEREQWRIDRSKNQFCSHSCYALSLIEQKTTICDYCHKTFSRRKSEIDQVGKHFCNIECRKKSLEERHIQKPCLQCGTMVTRTISETKKTKGGFLCNITCRKLFYQGVHHPRWTGGNEYIYGPGWGKQKKLATERDNHACRICGKTKQEMGREPDVHHIDHFFNNKNNDLSNLICLCPKHHRQVEKGQVLLKYYLNGQD